MLIKNTKGLVFNNKRVRDLITPCCGKHNKDGKFVNYKNLPSQYGFCHSCGSSVIPPTTYSNDNGDKFTWNENSKKFEPYYTANETIINTPIQIKSTSLKFIDESFIWQKYLCKEENNLLKYLRKEFGDVKTEEAKEMYVLGSSKEGGIMFWTINKRLQVQKVKISYYNKEGKRTDKFKVPFKNDDGYRFCLFGEHLLLEKYKNFQTIILVESEKTAVIGSILLPKYTWLAYGGLNGLTKVKILALRGFKKVLIIPDFSSNATKTVEKKILEAKREGIDIKLWDITSGLPDSVLKKMNVYNDDIEDVFRNIDSKIYQNIIQKSHN